MSHSPKTHTDIKISSEMSKLFVDMIHDKLGIIIQPQNKDLHNTIQDACYKFRCDVPEYFNTLTSSNSNSAMLEHLVASITIGETYFFRDEKQVVMLRDKILPNLIKKKRNDSDKSLRIWSAGCASGEEIYTIAILLQELLGDSNNWSIHLLGTDLNTASLAKANSGQYGKWSMRSISKYYLDKYFTEHNNKYTIKENIQQMVNFEYLNLYDDTYPSILNGTNAQDLIICRNVLIYFSKKSVDFVMQRFNSALHENGYLLLGASDPIFTANNCHEFHHEEGMLFRKVDPAKQPKQDHNLKKLHSRKLHTKKPLATNELMKHVPIHKTTASVHTEISEINAQAQSYANLGKLHEALECCELSLKKNSTEKDTYFIYSLIQIELDNLAEAEAALRKSLFLDSQFIEAHFQLGLLLLKNRKFDHGIKSLKNALSIVKKTEPNTKVNGFEDLTYGRFADILKTEIALYSKIQGQV